MKVIKNKMFMVLLWCFSLNIVLTPVIKAQTVSDPTICNGTVAAIYVIGSETGFTYKLVDPNNVNIGNPVKGNTGVAISFTAWPTASIAYHIDKFNDTIPNSGTSLADFARVTVKETPTVIKIIDGIGCVGSSVILHATSSVAGGVVNWYTSANDKNLDYTGDDYSIPSLGVGTYTYYAEAEYNGCVSARVPVTATINPLPATPSIVASTTLICEAGPLTLTATTSAPPAGIHWADDHGYTGTGTTINFPTITQTTKYTLYVTESGCNSASATQTVTVIPKPTVSSAKADPSSHCGAQNVTFSATASVGTIKWYDKLTGGNLVPSPNPFTTNISTTTTYFAEADNQGCVSVARMPATSTVTPSPTVITKSATPATVCESGSVTFAATASAGAIKWYDKLTGGNEVSPINPFTKTINTATTYYAEAVDNGCASARTSVTVTVTPKPTFTVSFSPLNLCEGGPVDFTASPNPPPGGGTVNWYRESDNYLISSANPYSTNLQLNNNPKIYATITVNGCVSDKVFSQANITKTPAITNYPTDTKICINTSTTLTATATDGDIKWYKNIADVTPVHTGNSYTTPILNTNTNYYIEVSKNGCSSSPRTTVPVTIIDLKISNTTAASRCGAGMLTLSATSSSGGGVFKWYNAATGGTDLYTGATFTTPVIQTTTDYWVSVSDGGCTSARIKVIATISAQPTVVSVKNGKRCGAGDVTLSATASTGGIIYWYTTLTGGNPLTNGETFIAQNSSQATTYYVDAVLNGCASAVRTPVTVTINPIPNAPTTFGAEECGTDILIHLSAENNPKKNDDTLKWYNDNGTYVHTGKDYKQLLLLKTTTYYVDATNSQGCTSSRTPVTATIKPTPKSPNTTSGWRCDAGPVTLTASGTGTLKWYATPNGNNSIYDGPSYPISSLNATTTYYVKAFENGCFSKEADVTAYIYATPKITSKTPDARCGAGKVTLRATSNVGVIRWYDAATTGNLVATNDALVITSLAATTDYWVEANNKGCVSLPRESIKATINTTPTTPTATGAERCDAGSVQLTATASPGDTINWYDSPSSNLLLGQGSPFNTPTISTTTNYYVSTSKGNCSSARVMATATINQTPTITSTTPSFVCDQGTVTLNAIASAGNVNWFTTSSGGLPVGDKPAFTTPSISDTTYYYVEAENKKCISTPRVKVAANVYKSPKIVTQPFNTTGCNNSTVKYEVVANGTMLTYQWQAETAPNIFTNIDDDATFSGTKTAVLSVKIDLILPKLKYRCIISSACKSATTNVATLTINNSASISSQPATVNSCTGNNAVFKVAASGGSLNYQWEVDAGSGFSNVPNIAPYTGANTPSLIVNNTTTSLTGYKYRCFVSSTICNTSIYSDGAVLNVNKIDIANAGSDQTLCIDTVLLKGSTPTSGSGTWTQTLGTGSIINKNAATTSVKGLGAGKNEFVWVIKNGNCSSADTVVITTSSAVTVANAGVDQIICANSTILTGNTATAGSTGHWSIVNGSGTIANANNQSTAVTALALGKNIFLWVIKNNACSSTDAVIIDVIAPPVANAGNDQTLCAVNAKLVSNSAAPGKGVWKVITGGGVISDSSQQNINVTQLTEGKNLFIWTISLGSCSSTDSVVLNVSIPPTKAVAGKDQSVCEDSTVLAATIPTIGSGKWTKVAGSGKIVDASKYNTTITGLVLGEKNTFVWTVSKATCTSSADTVDIDFTSNKAIVDAGKDQNVCKDSAKLTAFSKFIGSGRWQVASGNAVISQFNNDTTVVSNLSVGENKFIRLLNSNCGFAIDTVIVTRNENPSKAFAGYDEEICAEEYPLAANNPQIGIGKWAIVSGSGTLDNVTNPNATLSHPTAGNTVLRWIITSGACPVSIDDVLIKRISSDDLKCAEYQVSIPTGFSPNGDGINDKLVLVGLEKYPGAIVRVYNHLGYLVYEKQNYENDWNGIGNVKGIIGEGKLPAGTYYIYINLNNGHSTKARFIVIKY